jgi:hypothetical protein
MLTWSMVVVPVAYLGWLALRDRANGNAVGA